MPPPPRRPGRAPPPDYSRARARGVLVGLAVGDAMGVTFKGKQAPSPPFTERAVGYREVMGRGPHALAKGQTSDPTQLAVCLAQSLIAVRGYNPRDAMRRYRAWLGAAFSASEFMKGALAAEEGINAGLTFWIRGGRRLADPGSLARVAPIAVFFANRSVAVQAAIDDSALTHFHPRSQLACAAFVGMLGELIHFPAEEVPRERVIEAADGAMVEGAGLILRANPEFTVDVQQALADLRTDLAVAQRPDPELYGPDFHMWRHAGFVDVPFRMALFQMFQRRSYADALEDVINRGGSAEINGAITGALLGGLQGETAIPEPWLSATLGALHDKPGPLRDLYHPRKLLEVLDVTPEPAP